MFQPSFDVEGKGSTVFRTTPSPPPPLIKFFVWQSLFLLCFIKLVVAGKKKQSGYTRKQNFFFSSRTSKWALGPHPASYLVGARVLSVGKAAGAQS